MDRSIDAMDLSCEWTVWRIVVFVLRAPFSKQRITVSLGDPPRFYLRLGHGYPVQTEFRPRDVFGAKSDTEFSPIFPHRILPEALVKLNLLWSPRRAEGSRYARPSILRASEVGG